MEVYLDWLSSENEECLRSLRQKSHKLVHQDVLNLIRLLDFDADSDGINAGFNQHLLVFISGNDQWIEDDLRRAISLNLWDIVSFRGLRCEVAERDCRGE